MFDRMAFHFHVPKAFYVLIILLLLSSGLVFIIRTPVLILSDDSFETLYGVERAAQRRIEASLGLFRMVRTVLISSDAPSEAVVEAISSSSQNPHCVIFSSRYLNEALYYAQAFPLIPVAVLGVERGTTSVEEGLIHHIPVDRETDLYAAGLGAAALGRDKAGGIHLYSSSLTDSQTFAFRSGLEAGGDPRIPWISTQGLPSRGSEPPACLVLYDPPEGVSLPPTGTALVLFTWMDPHYLPAGTALIFDDSPYGLIKELVIQARSAGIRSSIPSKPWILAENKELKKIFSTLKGKKSRE